MYIYTYLYIYIHIYIYIGLTQRGIEGEELGRRRYREVLLRVVVGADPHAAALTRLSLYKILFHLKAVLWSISSFYCYPPACNAYNIAILLHAHCTIYVPPPILPLYAIHHTILMMAISCKGQYSAQSARSLPTGIHLAA